MSQSQVKKALRHLIRFKQARLEAGFWSETLPGHQVIDATLKEFGLEVDA